MAGPFSQDFIEAVRGAGDMVRLVSDYVPLKPSGSRMKGLCPFHEEKTPSFSVDPARQLFYCFGCQTGGDVFKFLMLYENLGFTEAVEHLASRWGVPPPAATRHAGRGPQEQLLELNLAAQRFFRSSFEGEAGAACREYVRKRGIDAPTAEKLGLGFSPDSWEALNGHLAAQRFRTADVLQAGLILPRKSGSGHYDRFRNRLMFPIRSVTGHTVAFGGRALGEGEPKYINSPETPAYTKGEHLYGLDLAKEAVRQQGFAVVVEGYLDLAAVLQAGFENVVASLGTSFTAGQARLLARYCNRVAFSYDGDAAGAKATERSLDLLLAKGFEVRVVELPGGADPDDFIRREGAEAYGALLNDAPEYLEYLIRRETRGGVPGVEDKVAAINTVLPHVARLAGAVERAAWATRLADALHVEDDLVLQELRRAAKSAAPAVRERPRTSRPLHDAEARLVSVLLASQDERARQAEAGWSLTDLEETQVLPIVRAIAALASEGRTVDYPGVLAALESDDDRELLTRIAFRDDPAEGPSVEDCLWSLRRARMGREEKRLRRSIGDLQESSASDAPSAEIDRQLVRFQELARQRDALS